MALLINNRIERKEFMKDRQSNFEVLRIIAMFCIVLGHAMTHGTLLNARENISDFNFLIFRFLAYGGKTGVYLFVLITGYFMIYSNISLRKVIKIWLPIFFWSVTLTLIVGFAINQLSFKDIVMSGLPILFNRYWFMSTYVFLYILIPIINHAILNLNTRQELLVTILGFFIILPSDYFYGNNINSWFVSFCFTYTIGAIIRKRKLLKNRCFINIGVSILLIGLVANAFCSFIITYAYNSAPLLTSLSTVLQKETLFCLFVAVGLFIWVGSKNIPYIKIINTIASVTFGIYLIHDNGKMEYFLWDKLFHMNLVNYPLIHSLLYVLICASSVFLVCSIIELIRKALFDKLENNISLYLENKIKTIFDKLLFKY